MASIKNLPIDIWVLIFEYFDLRDLLKISQSFTGIHSDVDVASFSAAQATKTLCQLIGRGKSKARIAIESDGVLWEKSLIPGFDYMYRGRIWGKPVKTSFLMSPFKPKQTLIAATSVKLNLAASYSVISDAVYMPELHGGDPLQPTLAKIQYFPTACGNIDNGYIELQYLKDPETSPRTHTLKDTQKSPVILDRVIGQELKLNKIFWRWIEYELPRRKRSRQPPQISVKQEELPFHWASFLGDKIHVEVVLQKHFDYGFPTPEQWNKASSVIKNISMTIETFTLPSLESLRRLFPANIIELPDDAKQAHTSSVFS